MHNFTPEIILLMKLSTLYFPLPLSNFPPFNGIISCFLFAFLFAACTKSSNEAGVVQEEIKINSFTITKADGTAFLASEYQVSISGDSVNITLPPLESRRNLKASLTFTGKSVTPANGSILNFSEPVSFTLTAHNGSTRVITIKTGYEQPKQLVFIGAGNTFYAIDAATGFRKWSFTGGGSFAYSSATCRDNVVYVGCIDNHVYSFNASNGRLLWKRNIASTGIESDAVIADSTVYVGTNDDILHALDAVTGETRWTFATGSNISSSPVVANGRVYFGSSDSKLYALNAQTGGLVWQYTTGAMLNQSGACLVNGTLYVGSRDGYLYAIDEQTGTRKWRFGSGTISFESSSPTVYNGMVYIGGWYNVPGFTQKGSLFAVDATTGNLVWEALPKTGFSSSPFVKNGRLSICGDNGQINVLNAISGNILWQKAILPNSSSPLEVNGIIYVGGPGTGYVYAFNAATGAEIWKFPIPGTYMASSPVVIDVNGETKYPGDSGILN